MARRTARRRVRRLVKGAIRNLGIDLVTGSEARQIAGAAYRQAEEYALLQARLPSMRATGFRGWAVSPDSCNIIVDHIQERRPRLVVELGSGLSSLVIGLALREFVPSGRLISIDHDATFARNTQEMLASHSLWNSSVRCAELTPVPRQYGLTEKWYDERAIDDLEDIDMLLIDGPPKGAGPSARHPSLRYLSDRMAKGGVVMLDDADRAEERELACLWAERGRTTPQFIPTEKGFAVITYSRP